MLAAGDTTTYGDLATAAGLKGVAKYADGVGPFKDYIIPRDADGHSLAPTSFVADAHAAGLVVHPYTFRNENQFLPRETGAAPTPTPTATRSPRTSGSSPLGVDGIISDDPDLGVAARNGPGLGLRLRRAPGRRGDRPRRSARAAASISPPLTSSSTAPRVSR